MAIKKLSKEYFDEICDVMSYDRLKRYRELLSEDLWHTGIVFIPYFVIQQASSMLLPTIQLVEIAMRNRIDKAIVNYYTQNYIGKQPDEWYFWIAEDDRTQRAINDAIERAEKETKYTAATHGDIVAHIQFGTWISILKELNKRDRYAWRMLAESIFIRNSSRNLPSVKHMITKLSEMNKYRNRLFHHEPIWSAPDVMTLDDAEKKLLEIHESALQCIFWLSPCLHDIYALNGMKYREKFQQTIEAQFDVCRRMAGKQPLHQPQKQ